MAKKILIGAVILIIAALAAIYFGPLRRRGAFLKSVVSQVAGPSCKTENLFNVPPVALGDFISITPLGNLSPPDHTVPTDHIYVVLKENNLPDPANAKTLRAPGDITVTRIRKDTAIKQGAVFSDDYAIDFSPCKEVSLNFGHVNAISDELKAVFEKSKPSCNTETPRPGDEYTYCAADLNYAVKAGTAIGSVGSGTSTGLDIRAVDRRSPNLSYANPARYRGDQFHFVCPLDLFDQAVRDDLYEKLGSGRAKRTTEPLCGSVAQDLAGTAQGSWITGVNANDLIDEPGNWDKSLALIHDNFDPTIGIASIGGVIGNPSKIAFLPKHEGTINREFSEVKPDSSIYCYYSNSQAGSGNIMRSEQLLVQLISATSLKAELQPGTCSGTATFSKPTTYER